MPDEWAEFFNVSPALDDNLRVECTFSIWMTRWPFADELKTQYSTLLFKRLFNFVRRQQLPIGELKFTDPEMAVAINAHQRATGHGGRVGWFLVSYTMPGRECAVHIDDEVIQLKIHSKSLRNLVDTIRFLAEGITELILEDDLETLLQVKNRTHSVEYRFDHQVELGKHRIEDRQVHNYEILSDALALTQRPVDMTQERKVQNALPSLGIERFVRIDYTHHAIIELRGNKYNSLVVLEAPWNVTQRRLDVGVHLRMEEEFGLRFPEAVDWRIAVVDFYRETILRRFFANLLAYSNCTYKGQ